VPPFHFEIISGKESALPNIQIEPQLQLLSGVSLSHRTSNTDEHARLDISAKGL